jgi:ATP-dependent Clp protease protease subunit
MKNWYRFSAKADEAVVDIHIIDFIGDWIDDYYGFGVTAKTFVDQLSKIDSSVKTIRVHINSPGGDVFAALNIANALREQQASKGRTVETIVEGLAASAASIIMMAGSTVRIADNAMVMIHDPWTFDVGNAADFRKMADDLDKIRNTIVATYKWHSTLTDEELVALMAAETWMDADEAIANGFATDKVEGLQAAAALDPRAIAKMAVPEKYRARVQALVAKPADTPKLAAASDVLKACGDAGLDLAFAQTLIGANCTADDLKARVTAEQNARADAAARATQIRALCGNSKLPELAEGYITGAMSLDAVRAQLTVITAKVDKVEIDGSLPVDGVKPKAQLIAATIYAERNRPTSTK